MLNVMEVKEVQSSEAAAAVEDKVASGEAPYPEGEGAHLEVELC